MEHEIAGQAVKAAMDGALVGTADRKKEPMTGKKALKAMERVMNALFFICGMVAVAFVLLISIYLIISGLPAILEIGPINFLFGTRWYASTGDFGIFAIILTSFAGTAGAILVGVPIGLMTAIFLSKVAPPKFAAVVHAAVELLAGIPSVVYGLVGMILLVPAIRVAFDLPSGATLLAAIIVLAVMILPSIVSVSETALRAGSMRRRLWPWGPPISRPCSASACPLPAAASPPPLCWASAGPSVRPWPSLWWRAMWPICRAC